MTIIHTKSGLHIRPGTLDSFTISEQVVYKHLPIQNGDLVMDVGANIGANKNGFREKVLQFVQEVEKVWKVIKPARFTQANWTTILFCSRKG